MGFLYTLELQFTQSQNRISCNLLQTQMGQCLKKNLCQKSNSSRHVHSCNYNQKVFSYSIFCDKGLRTQQILSSWKVTNNNNTCYTQVHAQNPNRQTIEISRGPLNLRERAAKLSSVVIKLLLDQDYCAKHQY